MNGDVKTTHSYNTETLTARLLQAPVNNDINKCKTMRATTIVYCICTIIYLRI